DGRRRPRRLRLADDDRAHRDVPGDADRDAPARRRVHRPSPPRGRMKIAFVVYPDFTALDLIGPYEVISRWPGAEVRFLASSLAPVRADMGLTVIPTDTPATLPDPDLIVVPGSGNPLPVLDDAALLAWLRSAAAGCSWTASVCTGASLYAAAGVLRGSTTTHWAFRDVVRAYGVAVAPERVVWSGRH